MIAKTAIVFVGIVLAGVFSAVYYAVLAFFTVFLFGIDSELAFTIQHWLCYVAGALTSFSLMRKTWPKTPSATDCAKEQAE